MDTSSYPPPVPGYLAPYQHTSLESMTQDVALRPCTYLGVKSNITIHRIYVNNLIAIIQLN